MEQAARAALALLLVFNFPVFATVEPIKKGAPAPYDGFVFDHASEAEASQARIDADYYKRLSDKLKEKTELQESESQILEKRLQLYMNQSDILIKERNSVQATEKWVLLGAFALGVIVTGFAVRNVRQ